MFEIFNKEKVYNKRGKPALLRFSKYGHIQFSTKACEILGLENGNKISFMIDNRDNGIVYFFKDENGIELHKVNNGKRNKGLQICCRSLSLKVLNYLGLTGNTTFDIFPDTTKVNNKIAWFVQKKFIHNPIQWKKK